ncbi:MAG: LysR family transcriptional regulator [Clostridia bacterium]|nr:LysR family transcriptional regulator [Clostridia bacterium]
MPKHLSIENIETFVLVAELGNISKVAEKLFISQPAVSQIINKIEGALKSQLLIRQSRGVILTTEGYVVLQDFKALLNNFNNTILKIKKYNKLEAGELKIGSGANISKWILSPTLKRMFKDYPNIKLKIKENATANLIEDVLNGFLDCALIPYQDTLDANLNQIIIAESRYVIITNSDNPEISKIPNDGIFFKDLKNYPFILQSKNSTTGTIFHKLCKKNNININNKVEVERFSYVLDLASQNIGLGFLPEYIVNAVSSSVPIKIIDLKDSLPALKYVVLFNKNNKRNMLNIFIQILQENSILKS